MPDLTNLQKRWITAIAIAIPLVFLLFKGSLLVIAIAVTIISFIAGMEFCYIFIPQEISSSEKVVFSSINSLYPIFAFFWGFIGLHLCVFLTIFFCMFYCLIFFPTNRFKLERIISYFFGWTYTGYLLAYLSLYRDGTGEFNRGLIWFVLFTVVATDVGAFFSGRRFGKRPLYKTVSPKKTVEGAIGGTVLPWWLELLLPCFSLPTLVCLNHSLLRLL